MIILHDSPLIDFLKKNIPKDKQNCSTEIEFLVILPDDIAIQNFNYEIMKQGISPAILDAKTFDDLAEAILDSDKKLGLRILDRRTLGQLISKIVIEAHSGPLKDLQLLPLNRPETQDIIVEEFEEYLRGTDVGTLHSLLYNVASSLEDSFISKSSVRILEAFRTLEQMIQTIVNDLGSSIFPSRAHYLKKAREMLSFSWPSALKVREVLISNISVFDATILKLVTSMAEAGEKRDSSFKVRIFQPGGTYPKLRKRLESAGVNFKEEKSLGDSFAEKRLKEYYEKGSLKFISAPERRREIEEVAKKIHELLLKGAHPSDILIVARDCGKYLNFISEIFPAFGISYYVQTRRPYAHLSPYRFVKATLDLILAADRNDVKWHEITDPLRLGFCLRKKGWPVSSKQFIYLEESLSRMQHKMPKPISLHEWRKRAELELRWDYPKRLLLEFLDWIQERLDNPPKEISEVRQLISVLLETYMFQQSCWSRKSYSPRVLNKERFVILELHPTHFATRIKSELTELENYLQDRINGLGETLSWKLISQAFGEVFGTKTYGLRRQDNSSVMIVDAGNSQFLKAKYLLLIGMRADEFPRKCPKGIFIPDELRNTLDQPASGESAFLYLRSRASDYANEYDFLETVLKTNPKIIWCFMPYLDERSHVCEWSSFFDSFKPWEDDKNRIPPDKWLPSEKGKSWEEIAKEHPPWIRQRLYIFHAYRQFPNFEPRIDEKGLEELASTLDPDIYKTQLKDRIERYLNPPRVIEVRSNEAWYSNFPLQKIIGPPFRTHEMDLHAICPMQLYFWQFLYLWGGARIDRDIIPPYFKRPHWRYGRIPKRLAYVYPSARTNERIRELIELRFPIRQESLLKFPDEISLEKHLSSFLSEFEQIQFTRTLSDEWSLVKQEKKDNIKRQWAWISGNQTVEIGQLEKVQVILPPHRLDDVQGSKIIIAYVNYSGQIRKLFYPKKSKKMESIVDPLKDYRIPVLLAYYYSNRMPIAAAIYAELFNAERRGYYDKTLLAKHKGPRGYEEELKMPERFYESETQIFEKLEFIRRVEQFTAAIITRARKMSPNPDLRFQATPRQDVCQNCVYNDLCQIPRVEGLL